MTEVLDRYDRRVARTATGELAELNAAGVIEAADVHVASRLATLVGDEDPLARVTLALVVRAAREGSTSLDPAHARELLEESPVALPPTPEWLEQVGGSAQGWDTSGGQVRHRFEPCLVRRRQLAAQQIDP